ncbi:ABC transporter permease [uncultured Microbacterium sp.]|uniref:ABC transporter permease n=1 Tax=uncultured Microbacterium sp. TaxID=191216 RepID=UPI0025D47C2E|nr:ABC transporter permease [uncultured Microbacterium sp.]
MSTLAGTRSMLGLTLRRERLHGSAWYLLSGLLLSVVAAGIVATYPTVAAREALAESVNASAGELFIIGPLSSTGAGGIALWRIMGIASLVLSVASVLTMLRNTRTPEENGTSEMLGSAAIGRAAPLAAALGATAAGSLAAAIVVGVGFLGLGASVTGSLLVGAQVASFGVLGAALAALVGQIVQTTRGATGLCIAFIAAFFLLRGAGDALGGNGYWLSPFGWIAAVHPFAADNASMLLPALALTIALDAVAIRIAARRDLGAGLMPERVGPAHASPALRGPVSLALRTSRGAVIGGAVGAFVVGLLIGGVASTVDRQIDITLGSAAGSASGLVQVALYLSPLFAAILGVQIALRLRGEVTSGRAEAVLSRPVPRSRWLLAHPLVGALAALIALIAFGLGIGIAQLGTDAGSFGVVALAGALRAPAAWVFVALAALLLATVPRAAAAVAFIAVGAFQALEFAVEFRILPREALLVSPFALVPQLPGGDPHPGRAVLLVLIGAVLVAVAARAIRRRDID